MECGSVSDVLESPRHPYTIGLLASVPRLSGEADRLVPIPGQPPSLLSLSDGCPFEPRCSLSQGRSRCREEAPTLRPIGSSATPRRMSFRGRAWKRRRVMTAERRALSSEVPSDDGLPREMLRLEQLVTHFPIRSGVLQRQTGTVRAVDGVDLTVYEGETVGLVGESGCGKTTLGRTALRLLRPTSGRIFVEGREITCLSAHQLRPVRRHLQMVFQDPYTSLNPGMTVARIITEPLRVHGQPVRRERVHELLQTVGLSSELQTAIHTNFRVGKGNGLGLRELWR